MSDVVRIVVEVPGGSPPPGPDAELRAAAESLLLGASDTVADLFTRNLVAVGRPALVRLAAACGVDFPGPGQAGSS